MRTLGIILSNVSCSYVIHRRISARKNAKELVELLLSAEKTLLASSPLTQAIVGLDGGL